DSRQVLRIPAGGAPDPGFGGPGRRHRAGAGKDRGTSHRGTRERRCDRFSSGEFPRRSRIGQDVSPRSRHRRQGVAARTHTRVERRAERGRVPSVRTAVLTIGQSLLRMPDLMPSPIAPLNLPRLPVLGWRSVFGMERDVPPAVIDLKERIFVRSGRAAIALALQALGIGRGDRVLVPTYHCPTMIAPVVAAGATPEFFPIDAAGAPDLSSLSAQRLTRVRAMIAAHYFGLPQAFAPTRAFCDRNNIAF